MPSPFAPFGPSWCHGEVGRAVEHTGQSVFSTLRVVFYSLMKGMAEGKCSIELLNGGFLTQSECFTSYLQMEEKDIDIDLLESLRKTERKKTKICQTPMRRPGFEPWVGKIPWRRAWLLQYSWLENPMDRGAWWAIVLGVAKSGT